MNRKIGSFLTTLVLIAITIFGFSQRQWIKDFYIVQTTDVEARSQTVSDQLALTDSADFIYQASQPKIQAADQFNQSCRDVSKEYSIVLGCYTQQKLFVFDVQDERLDGVIQVTAAHELLHGVYDRLTQSEKDDLDAKLVAFADTVTEKRFNETVQQYKDAEPDQLANELHSMVGTELEVIPPELEEYYKKYFTDRAVIVGYAQRYESALEQYSAQIASYNEQLKSLETQKNSLETSLQQQEQAVKSEGDRLNGLRTSGDAASYNSQVPGYNNKIQQFNTDISRVKQMINEYNALVEKRNAVATSQNDLAQKLDSRYQVIE